MSKLTYIGVTILVLVASAAIVSWSLGLGPSKPPQKETKQKTQVSESTSSAKTAELLPIEVSSNAVKSAKVRYVLNGTIRGIKNVSQGVELTVKRSSESLPKLTVKSSTPVVLSQNGVQTALILTNLKVTQVVRITAEYDLKQKTWEVRKVVITKEATASSPATSSANSK